MIDQSPAFVWDVSGKPVRVHISSAVMDRIAAEIEKGVEALTPGGAEVGGVLLGAVSSGEPHVVSIHSVEPVTCEYAYGPSFILTEKDELRLSAALGRLRSDPAGLQPVGFYRSVLRGALSLSEQDLWLFATHFSLPHEVALIVRPREGSAPVAGFFFWESGTIKSDASYKEFLLGHETGSLPAGANGQEAPAVAPQPASPEAPIDLLSFGGLASAPTVRRIRIPSLRNPSALATLAASILLSGGILGFVAGRLWRSAPAPVPRDPYALSLSVAEYGENLHLRWDRNAPAIVTARGATLSISDGDITRPLDIGREQLRNGSIVYRRLTPKVRMRLDVQLSDRGSVAESWESPGR